MFDELKIGCVRYRVVRDAQLGNDGALGWINTNRNEIRIAAGMPADREAVVVWHEVIHGILFGAGYHEHDEQMVEALAHGVVAALADNAGKLPGGG